MFAVTDGGYLKMVGLQKNGQQESKYQGNFNGEITFEVVKQAWESSTNTSRGYRVKDMSSCFESESENHVFYDQILGVY